MAMDLLPKCYSDFASASYWESFFTKRSDAFEWYGNYLDICGILHRYIKPKDDILVIGCGNSELSENLYDAGHHKILNIDISKTVIDQMKIKNEFRNNMEWKVMDVTNLDLQDGTYTVVLDKGTLDAILCDYSSSTLATVENMFKEIERVLRIGGRYICITLAQDPLMATIFKHLSVHNWLVRIHKVSVQYHKDQDKIQMPVFAIVLTKFNNLPRKILEICLDDDSKPSAVDSEAQILDFFKTQQNYAIVRSEFAHGKIRELYLPPVELFVADELCIARYVIHIIDIEKYNLARKFGIFIVPQGRELEWLFSSAKGRLQVAESAQFKRLAVVLLSRDHVYEGGMKQIQSELSQRVMELAPANLDEGYEVPFLSTGDDVGERHVRCRGESLLSGPFVVEDYIGDEGTWYRQLLFNSTLIQTVVKLKRSKVKGRTKKKKQKSISNSGEAYDLVPDPCYFAARYMEVIASGFTSVINSLEDQCRVLIIGLGGGAQALHLLHIFSCCSITAIEVDDAIVNVSKTWFGLSEDVYKPRLNIITEDGLVYVESLAKKNETFENDEMTLFDVIILDVDSKDQTKSLRCPSEDFVTNNYLQNLNRILSKEGVLMINVVCREESVMEQLEADFKVVFPTLYKRKCDLDVNTVVFCYNDDTEKSLRNEEQSVDQSVHAWRSKAKRWENVWKKCHPNTKELDFCLNLQNVLKI